MIHCASRRATAPLARTGSRSPPPSSRHRSSFVSSIPRSAAETSGAIVVASAGSGTELVASGEPCESGSDALDAVRGEEGCDERSARECSTALRRRGSFFSNHARMDSIAMVLNSGSLDSGPFRES